MPEQRSNRWWHFLVGMIFSDSVECTDNGEPPKLNKSVLHKQFQDYGKGLPPEIVVDAHSHLEAHLAS